MPNRNLLSLKEAANLLLPGGKWDQQTALNISSGAEANVLCGTGHRTALLYSDVDFYLLFDTVNGAASISASNSLIIPAARCPLALEIPYDIGQTDETHGPSLHVKQVGAIASKYVRVVLR